MPAEKRVSDEVRTPALTVVAGKHLFADQADGAQFPTSIADELFRPVEDELGRPGRVPRVRGPLVGRPARGSTG